jgi:hypothetical protein
LDDPRAAVFLRGAVRRVRSHGHERRTAPSWLWLVASVVMARIRLARAL